MKISAKEILLILLGLIATSIFTLLLGDKLNDLKNISPFDTLIFLVAGMVAVIIVIYKRIGEIDKDINEVKEKCLKLDERLKIHQLLTNLEARIINLEENKNGKR